ncbi:MAG: glutamate racemase [Deltaproteobacteria bacterium]|nr:glutamate racemase [Deltaproteobacteria bacterium]
MGARVATASAPIGIFDSGVGGLTVYRAIAAALPHESLCYLGDTARVPYGNKSPETVTRYSLEIGAFLAERGIKALVVACNTSSAVALPALRARFGFPIIGVIEPGVEAALAVTTNRRIGVIATAATIASQAYAKTLKARAADARIVSRACPLFVPLVEEGWTDGAIVDAVIHRYLEPLRDEGIDTLILGCTHYPLLAAGIGALLGSAVQLVDSGTAAAGALRQILQQHGLFASPGAAPQHRLYVTDAASSFAQITSGILGQAVPAITTVTL